jgi:hypothetical protein
LAVAKSRPFEAHHVTTLVISFIDRESGLGQTYFEQQAERIFYREAIFYSAAEVATSTPATGPAA